MKKLFLFIILVGRNWAIGSSERNKSARARLGLASSISMYLMGGAINLLLVGNFPLKNLFGGNKEIFMLTLFFTLLFIIIAPIWYVKKLFPDELLMLKVNQADYNIKYNRLICHFVSIMFVFGGFVCLFFLPSWLN
ncbi:hypothetical protein [Flocculibacter collagenilyticus]|uniref:hypothetical protein n=1 Tax=Flocculibacter collagenilyticus TaxID=2744479 RepID=UPI0018F37513|nr:hypothetical protein [Flocculibacter collagenilyticus]